MLVNLYFTLSEKELKKKMGQFADPLHEIQEAGYIHHVSSRFPPGSYLETTRLHRLTYTIAHCFLFVNKNAILSHFGCNIHSRYRQ